MGSRLTLSLLDRYRPTTDTTYPKHAHPTPSARPCPAHPDVAAGGGYGSVGASGIYGGAVELVAFGRREALATPWRQIGARQAQPKRLPAHKDSSHPAWCNEHGRTFFKVATELFFQSSDGVDFGQTEFP